VGWLTRQFVLGWLARVVRRTPTDLDEFLLGALRPHVPLWFLLLGITAAIRYDPKDADAYWSRHLCKQELGDTAGAAADKQAAKRIDPRIEEQWMQ
jgi:hypothetical protein